MMEQDQLDPEIAELAELAREVYQEIVNHLGVAAQVQITKVEDLDFHLHASGDEDAGGSLIGRRGQTLEAVQILVGSIVARRTPKRIRVFVDAFGYETRRIEALQQMALNVADQVRSQGEEALTDPLNSSDRRIIHTALQDAEGVKTYSEGRDPNRYVVISPAD